MYKWNKALGRKRADIAVKLLTAAANQKNGLFMDESGATFTDIEKLRLVMLASDFAAGQEPMVEYPKRKIAYPLSITAMLILRDMVEYSNTSYLLRPKLYHELLSLIERYRANTPKLSRTIEPDCKLTEALCFYLVKDFARASHVYTNIEEDWVESKLSSYKETNDLYKRLGDIFEKEKIFFAYKKTVNDDNFWISYYSNITLQSLEQSLFYADSWTVLRKSDKVFESYYLANLKSDKNSDHWILYNSYYGNETILKTYGREKPDISVILNYIQQNNRFAQSLNLSSRKLIKETRKQLEAATLSMNELDKKMTLNQNSTTLTVLDARKIISMEDFFLADNLKLIFPDFDPVNTTGSKLFDCLDGKLEVTFDTIKNKDGTWIKAATVKESQ